MVSHVVRAAYDIFTDWLLDWWEGPTGGARDTRALSEDVSPHPSWRN